MHKIRALAVAFATAAASLSFAVATFTLATAQTCTPVGNAISDLLQKISQDPAGSYCLTTDIEVNLNFPSIATLSGTLDGRGFSINNLRDTLFSSIDPPARSQI